MKLSFVLQAVFLFIAFVAFSFPGVVTDFLDHRDDLGVFARGKFIQEASISHGWPMVFLRRKARLRSKELLPIKFNDFPPCLIWSLWNPCHGSNEYLFSFLALFVDLLAAVTFSLSFCSLCLLIKSALGKKYEKGQILVSTFSVLISSIMIASIFYRSYETTLFENHCKQIGAKLHNSKNHTQLIRLFGKNNIPKSLEFHTYVDASKVSNDDFGRLVKSKATWVTTLSTPPGQALDDAFIASLEKNFHLPELDLLLDSPIICVNDLSVLAKVGRIFWFNYSSADKYEIERHSLKNVHFIGAVTGPEA